MYPIPLQPTWKINGVAPGVTPGAVLMGASPPTDVHASMNVEGGIVAITAHNAYLESLVPSFEHIADLLQGPVPQEAASKQTTPVSGDSTIGRIYDAANVYGALTNRLAAASVRIHAALHG